MNQTNITSAQYMYDLITGETTCMNIIMNGVQMSVPLDPANRHYALIMEQVETGALTIAEADNG